MQTVTDILLPSITENFLRTAKRYPDNILFHYSLNGWESITYHAFSVKVKALASYLINEGLSKGDRVAIISENRPEWGAAYLSILMAGGIAVPVDSQLGHEEIKNLLSDSGAKIIFFSQKTIQNVLASSEELQAGREEQIGLINFDSNEYKQIVSIDNGNILSANIADDIASIIYTSGTTGNPKGVMLTHNNFCSDAQAIIEAGIVSHEDNVLSVLPLHHTYAFMCTFLAPLLLGASITYPASLKGPDLMSAIKDRRVSILVGVPQLLGLIRNGIINKIKARPRPVSYILLKLLSLSGILRKNFGFNSGRIIFKAAHKALEDRFRFFASGGARLDPLIMEDLEALGFTVLEGYGLTETAPVVTFNPAFKRKPGSAGRPLPSVDIRINEPSETGEGEVAIKGPMVMKGYYKKPSATADVIKDGWFMTGDIGRVDNEGYLFITGRSKEVIILSSGKNIYPEDVEKMYMKSPLIKEICVLGIEEKGITENLHAVIVPDFEYARQAGISNIQESIKWVINDLLNKIPSYMRIKGYTITKEPLPRTPLGKLRRFMIKDIVTKKTVATEEIETKAEPMDEITEKMLEVIRQFSGKRQKISLNDSIELDLGLDSLSRIELIVALEKAFSLHLPEDFMADILTVRDLIEKIRKQTTAQISTGIFEKTRWDNILGRTPSDNDLSLISLERPEKKMLPSLIIYSLLKCLFKAIFRLQATGVEQIPKDKNYIIAPNHTSYLDGAVLILSLPFSYFKNIYTLGLSEFFSGMLKSRFARLAHVIPIDSYSFLTKALQMSAYVLKNDRSLSVFPEGGRSFDGNLLEFKKGVGILAVEMGIPVVPTLIEGAFEALPRDAVMPKFNKISITFGKPLLASEIDFSKKPEEVDDYQHFANLLRERVMELKVTKFPMRK